MGERSCGPPKRFAGPAPERRTAELRDTGASFRLHGEGKVMIECDAEPFFGNHGIDLPICNALQGVGDMAYAFHVPEPVLPCFPQLVFPQQRKELAFR